MAGHHISNTEQENGEYPVVWLSPVDCTRFSAKNSFFSIFFSPMRLVFLIQSSSCLSTSVTFMKLIS